MRVQDLKRQFHASFPFLKIEFFEGSHRISEGSSKANMLDNLIQLDTLLKNMNEGVVELNALSSVAAFEQLLDESFGLHVQVFRKSGNLFLETTKTDDWTLAQQNAEGKLSCESNETEPPQDMTDRDQWE